MAIQPILSSYLKFSNNTAIPKQSQAKISFGEMDGGDWDDYSPKMKSYREDSYISSNDDNENGDDESFAAKLARIHNGLRSSDELRKEEENNSFAAKLARARNRFK